MLNWFERLDTALVCGLLERWPTLEQLRKVREATLRTFWSQGGLMESRMEAIRRAIPAIRDWAVVQARRYRGAEPAHREGGPGTPRRCQLQFVAGAGAVMAPRLLAAFGSQREQYRRAADLQSFSGIALVIEGSGNA